jgi:hypothetical protein
MISITDGKGFQLKFANGWTVSVQFGPMNYCDNKSRSLYSELANARAGKGCSNAEIAAWDADGNWLNFGHDTVKGWVSADEVATFLAEIAGK